MRRSAIALGASLLALALNAGPAAAQAEGPVQQQVTDSTGAIQVGPTAVDAPVRVLSDGGDAGDSAGDRRRGSVSGERGARDDPYRRALDDEFVVVHDERWGDLHELQPLLSVDGHRIPLGNASSPASPGADVASL